MANARFYCGDLEKATYTMSETEDASYPLVNLKTYFIADQWRSSTTDENQTLNIDFGSAVAKDYVIIDNHNFNAIADTGVKLQTDDGDDPAFPNPTTQATLSGAGNSRLKVEFNSVTKRYWRILFNSTVPLVAVPQLGQIFIEQKFDLGTTIEWPWKAKNESFNTSRKRAIDGTLRTNQMYKGILAWQMKFGYLGETAKASWLRHHQKVRGAMLPFYMYDPDSNGWYLQFSEDANDIDAFRYQLNNTGSVKLESQLVDINPLT